MFDLLFNANPAFIKKKNRRTENISLPLATATSFLKIYRGLACRLSFRPRGFLQLLG